MRLVAILISLLLAERAYAFSSAIYGEFRNTLPSTVTVELTNRSGSVYRRMTITPGGTGKSPITNGTARVFDSTRHPVARGVTVKLGEKPLFDFEHKRFYYEIRTGKVVTVTVRQGRSWLKLSVNEEGQCSVFRSQRSCDRCGLGAALKFSLRLDREFCHSRQTPD
jgi:hypothetical protein